MPALKVKGSPPAVVIPTDEPTLRLANSGDIAGSSDVAFLQKLIEAEFSEVPAVRPWPRWVGLAVTFTIASALWCAIFWAGRALLRS
jgi:hypothetical protein